MEAGIPVDYDFRLFLSWIEVLSDEAVDKALSLRHKKLQLSKVQRYQQPLTQELQQQYTKRRIDSKEWKNKKDHLFRENRTARMKRSLEEARMWIKDH